MSKKEAAQNSEHIKNGTTILTANSREELFAKFNELKTSSEGATLMTGCVGENPDGTFELMVNINK
jgi:hypothetical protein